MVSHATEAMTVLLIIIIDMLFVERKSNGIYVGGAIAYGSAKSQFNHVEIVVSYPIGELKAAISPHLDNFSGAGQTKQRRHKFRRHDGCFSYILVISSANQSDSLGLASPKEHISNYCPG